MKAVSFKLASTRGSYVYILSDVEPIIETNFKFVSCSSTIHIW